MSTELDRFGITFFHKTKANGYFYEMSDDPANDTGIDHLDEDFTISNGIITMHPNGPTSFGVGKNIRGFEDAIDGCKMKFSDAASRGYIYKPDDVRDLEYKCLMKVNGIGGNGISISACTGHHDSENEPCCQGYAYMFNIQPDKKPVTFRFRKEMYHADYANSPEGWMKDDALNFKIDGHGWFGFGFCRYNTGPTEVTLEGWANPNPEQDIKNWRMIKKIKDFKGHGWGDKCDTCHGDKDQVGTWSGPQNRLKTNATHGTIDFKCISFREIDPTLD
jgi:hypothetical protein